MNVHQTERTLTQLRYLAMYDQSPLARMFRELDAHLSAGGTPPEAWREGPDAPADDDPTLAARAFTAGVRHGKLYGQDDDR